MLCCPVCKKALSKNNRQYRCENHHCFDIAKQGYTNLYLKSSKNSGDNKQMVDARTNFLSLSHYRVLNEAICKMLHSLKCDVLVDAGCGEGYYTKQLAKEAKQVFAFDLSKEALKISSKQSPDIDYFLSSIFELPLSDSSVDVISNIFAPCAEKEFARILKPGGYLIKVDPNVDHLHQMKEILYDDVVNNTVLDLDIDGFTLERYEEISFMMDLNQEGIESLFKMTPYAYKTKQEKSEQLLKREQLCCKASFMIYLFKKNDTN